MKKPISFIITCPYYDSGIKSLGSKCLFTSKRKNIIEKQCYSIAKFCANTPYEIILVNSIENYKTQKFIQKKLSHIKYLYLDCNNINYGGSFLEGLALAKYPDIVNIECGLVLSPQCLKDLDMSNTDIGIGCITHKHKQNEDIDLGCVIDNGNVLNLFFGLEHKYIGVVYINEHTKHFIINNFKFEDNKNKFLFEILNYCISKGSICKPSILKNKDTHLVFNKKSLQQYIG